MRIGFDGGCLSNRRGFGRYARSMITALGDQVLPHQLVLFVDEPSLTKLEIPSRFELVPVQVREAPSQAASANGRRRFTDMLAFGQASAQANLDAIIFLSSYSFYPVWNVGTVAVTVFDTLPSTYPEYVFPNWRSRLLWGLKEKFAVQRADILLTASQAARRDIAQRYRRDPSGIEVIPGAPDPRFRPTTQSVRSDEALVSAGLVPRDRYLIYVGGLSPHKNLPRLLIAFSRLLDKNLKLLIVGDFRDVFHTELPTIMSVVQRLGIIDRVIFSGFVPDEDLLYLYGRALALVQPSLLEGFGLPTIEAMACGTPVIASHTGSLPEVIGNAGLFFDPLEPVSIQEGLLTFLEDPALRDRLSVEAQDRAAQFSWERSAQSLIKLVAGQQAASHAA